jgi:hypothetical protein
MEVQAVVLKLPLVLESRGRDLLVVYQDQVPLVVVVVQVLLETLMVETVWHRQ